MRVYLDAQLLSSHIIELIDNYTKDDNNLNEEYSPLRLVIKKIDCLIDIQNNYYENKNKSW